jgi:hypothetical protein
MSEFSLRDFLDIKATVANEEEEEEEEQNLGKLVLYSECRMR